MRVEFAGVPGSGKSTLASQLLRSYPFISPFALPHPLLRLPLGPLRHHAARSLLRHKSRRLTKALRRSASPLIELVHHTAHAHVHLPPSARRQFAAWTLDSFTLRLLADELLTNHEPFLNDEGTAHRAITLFADHPSLPNESLILDYLSHLPPLDLLVIVDAPDQDCLLRIQRRSKGPPRRFQLHPDPHTIRNYFTNARRIASLTARYLRSEGTTVLHLDTSRTDPNTSLDLVTNALPGPP